MSKCLCGQEQNRNIMALRLAAAGRGGPCRARLLISSYTISREMTTFDVRLGGIEGGLRGTLKLGGDGLSWNAQNGDRKISVSKSDAESAEWFRTGPKHFQFRVRQSDNVQYRSLNCFIRLCTTM